MMSQPVTRAYDAVVDSVNKDDMSIVARINTSGVDRYNTVIPARGGRFKNWRASGSPVLWEHGKDARRFTDPIANSKGIWNNGGPNPTEILAEPRFVNDDFSRQRFEWYRDGIVKGWSVNILPSMANAGPPTKEEIRSRPDLEGVSMIYREWDLAEFSGTVIPGNADALTADRAAMVLEYVHRGMLWLPDEAKEIYEKAKGRTMSDSEGGMAKGGATVKAKGKDDDDDDKEDEEEEKKKRDAPWIDSSNGVHIVRGADGGAILTTADEEVARQCLGIMGQTRTFEQAHHAMTQEMRTQFNEFKSDITALVDLMVRGRV